MDDSARPIINPMARRSNDSSLGQPLELTMSFAPVRRIRSRRRESVMSVAIALLLVVGCGELGSSSTPAPSVVPKASGASNHSQRTWPDHLLIDDLDRRTDEPEVLDYSVAPTGYEEENGPHSRWTRGLYVNAMEFVRDDPLESELRRAIDAAARSVAGVEDVVEEDREIWLISGNPDGRQLFDAIGAVVDTFAPQIRKVVDG